MTEQQVVSLFHTMSSTTGPEHAFTVLNTQAFCESLHILMKLWKALSPKLQAEVCTVRDCVEAGNPGGTPRFTPTPSPGNTAATTPITPPRQYPTMTSSMVATDEEIAHMTIVFGGQCDMHEDDTKDEEEEAPVV